MRNFTKRQKLWDNIGYDPHPAQKLIHDSPARFKIPCCGRRFGKSTTAIADMFPDFLRPNGNFWLVGPTYELGEREFSIFLDFLRVWKQLYNLPGIKISYSPNAGNMSVHFPWNTMVKVVSAEKPKSLQGKGLNGVIMCEAGEHAEITWNKYVRPALSDERGRAIFPSTPKGYNWYYGYYQRGQDPAQTEWESWQFPSWLNTHKYPLGLDDPEFVEIKLNTSDIIWQQEYCASFVSFEGKVYAEFDEPLHVTDLGDVVKRYIPFWRNYWGVDFGFRDPFVVLDIMVDPEDNIYVWREYYKSSLATIQHCDVLRRRDDPAGYHVDCIFADPSAADGIATLQLKIGQVFARRVEPMQAMEQIKMLMQGAPYRDDEGEPQRKQRFFVDRSCENLIRELNAFSIKPTKGQTKREDFAHEYSHAPDALRYFAGEYFVLGAGARMSDMYEFVDAGQSDTFFQYDGAVEWGLSSTL